MAYCLHISRRHMSSPQEPITLQEWEAIVKSDPDMQLVDSIKARSPEGRTIEIKGEGTALWSNAERKIHFTYFSGSISCSQTDTAVQFKMNYIAELLEAEVRGDDGELYTLPEELRTSREITELKKSVSLSEKADSVGRAGNRLFDKWWFKPTSVAVVVLIVLIKQFWLGD